MKLQHWVNYDKEEDIFKIGHGYDRASNRLYADRQIYGGYSQLYQYDHLHRLTDFESGILNEDKDDVPYWPFRDQGWTLDSVGNQTAVAAEGKDPLIISTFNEANEYKSEVGSMKFNGALSPYPPPKRHKDLTDEDGCNYQTPGANDYFDINVNSVLLFTGVSHDTDIENESRGLVIFGENIGPINESVWISIPEHSQYNASEPDYAGIVFGYEDVDDYWMFVVEVVEDEQHNRQCVGKLYHVINGTRNYVEQTDIIPWQTNRVWGFSLAQRRRGMRLTLSNFVFFGPAITKTIDLPFESGIPTGKIGAVTSIEPQTGEVNPVSICYTINVDENTYCGSFYGRWYKPISKMAGLSAPLCTYTSTDWDGFLLHRGIRTQKFKVTLGLIGGYIALGSSPQPYTLIAFDAKDGENFDFIRIPFNTAPTGDLCGYEVKDGRIAAAVPGDPHPEHIPTLGMIEKVWVRVEYDGTNLTVKCIKNDTEPTNWDVTPCYTSSSFDIDGGTIGIGSMFYIKKVIVECNYGDSWVTEAVEDYTILTQDSKLGLTPTCDAAGNLTFDGLYAYKYDAWNRLTTVTRAYPNQETGHETEHIEGSVVATMEYDGLGRRIVKAITNSADWDCTYNYYYNGQQMVEVRNGFGFSLKQYVWGLQYVDELCQIMIAPYPGENNKPNYPFWILQDANFNTLGVISRTGRLIERYEYTPYGQRTVFSHGWLPADFNDNGSVTGADYIIWAGHSGTGTLDEGDANGDGSVTDDDRTIWSENINQTVAFVDDPLVLCPRLGSYVISIGGNPMGLCDVGHQGLLHDREFGLIYNRARFLSPTHGRFLQRDPIGYVDGMSLYEYIGSNPLNASDPNGLDFDWKKISSTDEWYEATKDKADLKKLAMKILESKYNSENWKCLWPIYVPDTKRSRKLYKTAKAGCGDIYDVSNLLAKEGPTLKAIFVHKDKGLENAKWYTGYTEIFNSGDEIGDRLKTISNSGLTPIDSFILFSHGTSSGNMSNGKNSLFGLVHLKEAKGDRFDLMHYDREAPKMCWFRPGATVRFVGCHTSPPASVWAKSILRKGNIDKGIAYGTTRWLQVELNHGGRLLGLIEVALYKLDPFHRKIKTPFAAYDLLFNQKGWKPWPAQN